MPLPDSSPNLLDLLRLSRQVCLSLALSPFPHHRQRKVSRPIEHVLVPSTVDTVPKIHPINQLIISSHSRQKMPPSMAFGQDSPRQSNRPPPLLETSTVDIVQVPQQESSEEQSQAPSDHLPHALHFHRINLSEPRLQNIERAA